MSNIPKKAEPEAKTEKPIDLLLGETRDGYVVDELVGVGGFARVYKVHPEGLEGKPFAMKIVADERHFPLLEAEAELLEKLDHPRIPSPIRQGIIEEGRFLVMNYVPNTLEYRLQQIRVLDYKDALEITQQIGEVLVYAHGKRIVHKDLKPRNIGLSSSGEVVLLDFNIAKDLTEKNNQQTPLENTQLTDIIKVGDVEKSILGGTEGYSSPEQRKIPIEGKVHDVDGRTDVYTTGVILYRMLTGDLPVGNFKKPSEAFARHDTIPRWVDMVVDKALDPNPKRRYQKIEDLVVDIDKGLHGGFDKVKGSKESLINKVKEYSWEIIKFPFKIVTGLYTFAPARYLEDETNEGIITVVGAVPSLIVWGATIATPFIALSNKRDAEFLEHFRQNPKGTIVYVHDPDPRHREKLRIHYFSAKDSLEEVINYGEVITSAQDMGSFLYVQGGTILFTGIEKDFGHSIYSINLNTGNGQRLFNLDETIEKLAATKDKEERERVLTEQGLWKADKKIKEIKLVGEGDNKLLMIRIGDNWYSTDLNGQGFKRENLVYATTNKPDYKICPDGQHRLDNWGELVQIEWNSNKWGSYNTPLRGTPKLWIPDEIEIKN